MENEKPTLEKVINASSSVMTPKSRKLADFVMSNPQSAVFMTTRELATEVGVSEATVVRFVRQLGYESYAVFIKKLRDHIDTGLTLMERRKISCSEEGAQNCMLNRVISREIENLKLLSTSIDPDEADKIIEILDQSQHVFVIGSRLSYASAYYLGWSMTKVRQNIHILKGSDKTSIDWLAIAPEESSVIMVATSRYPNELIRIGKFIHRKGMKLVLLADSSSCPIIQFSNHHLVAPMMTIPFLGSPTSLSCLINYLVHSLAEKRGEALKEHQEKLEQAYWENDVLFNLELKSFIPSK